MNPPIDNADPVEKAKASPEPDEAASADHVDDFNWRGRVTTALRQDMAISAGRATELIHQLRKALLPFSSRHAALRRYYDSESGRMPEEITVPRQWLADAYDALQEVV